MKINYTGGTSGINGGRKDEPSVPKDLRDPNIEDLPRDQGKPVASDRSQIRTMLAQILMVEGEEVMGKLKKVEAGLFLSDNEFEEYIGEIADAFINDLKETKPNELETLEAYTARVRQHLFLDCKDYKERVKRGFKLVQSPLIKDEWAKNEEKKLPPGTVL